MGTIDPRDHTARHVTHPEPTLAEQRRRLAELRSRATAASTGTVDRWIRDLEAKIELAEAGRA
jgi:hypothetical protein